MNLSESTCSLAVLAGRKDVSFLALMANHLRRQHSREFQSRVLLVDDLPDPDSGPAVGSSEFERLCANLERTGIFTSRTYLSHISSDHRIIKKHFVRPPRHLRDYRGVPLFGWIAGLESSPCRFHVHFDSDIFIYQESGFDWIDEGISVLRRQEDTLCVAPHPGPPPARNGQLLDQSSGYTTDPLGNFVFNTFSSRRFLVERERFERILPLPVTSASRRIAMKSLLTRKSALQNWEALVCTRMRETGMCRVHLKNPAAWALHAPDHGDRFLEILPFLMSSVESGWYPPDQAGRYDLDLKLWWPYFKKF